MQGTGSREQLAHPETPAAGHPEKPQGAVVEETESKEGESGAAAEPGQDECATERKRV